MRPATMATTSITAEPRPSRKLHALPRRASFFQDPWSYQLTKRNRNDPLASIDVTAERAVKL